jgi:N-acetylglutamate synthase-like GNAT family acetyltransferase
MLSIKMIARIHVRRATVDDLPALKDLWESMRLSPETLEHKLTEFQVVENAGHEVLGAIGIEFAKPHALLHSEGYTDFAIADEARQLFWERLQTLASNLGIFRLWTQERSPFWKSYGFQPPSAELQARLPEVWRNEFSGAWLTIQLKDEAAISAALEQHEQQFATARQAEIQVTQRAQARARNVRILLAVVFSLIALFLMGLAGYMFFHNRSLSG